MLFLLLFQSNSKLKLVRSLAVCEESSSPFVDGLLESQVGPEPDKLCSGGAQKIPFFLELLSYPGLPTPRAKEVPREAVLEGGARPWYHCLYVHSHSPSFSHHCTDSLGTCLGRGAASGSCCIKAEGN